MNVLPFKKIIFGFILVLVAGFLFYYTLKLIEPSYLPQSVLISNITDHQAAVSWVTEKATKGSLILSTNGRFPILPVFTRVFKDDGEKRLKQAGFYTTHHITIAELEPNKTYQFRIYQGWKKQVQGSFTTGTTLQSINTPNPVYGRILTSDKKPIIGAIVYLQVVDEASKSAKAKPKRSALLSALTNTEGRWSIDLANLREGNLKQAYLPSKKSQEQIIVEGGIYGRGKANTTINQDNPWPDIVLINK